VRQLLLLLLKVLPWLLLVRRAAPLAAACRCPCA
jgi:hypothetical protein